MQRTVSGATSNHFATVLTRNVPFTTLKAPLRLSHSLVILGTVSIWRKTASAVLLTDGLPGFFFRTAFFVLGIIPHFTPHIKFVQRDSVK
jgi:hypothetical protein